MIPELLNICLAVGSQLAIKTSSWSVGQLHVVDDFVAGLDLTLRNAVSNHCIQLPAQQRRVQVIFCKSCEEASRNQIQCAVQEVIMLHLHNEIRFGASINMSGKLGQP